MPRRRAGSRGQRILECPSNLLLPQTRQLRSTSGKLNRIASAGPPIHSPCPLPCLLKPPHRQPDQHVGDKSHHHQERHFKPTALTRLASVSVQRSCPTPAPQRPPLTRPQVRSCAHRRTPNHTKEHTSRNVE